MDFKKKSRPFFIIIFKLKNGNFKTQDFSPLIEIVLAGVGCQLFSHLTSNNNKNVKKLATAFDRALSLNSSPFSKQFV